MEEVRRVVPDLKNPGHPLRGVITAGQPERRHLEALGAAGYRTVVDMREPDEDRGMDEPAVVRGTGMEYVSLPVGHGSVDDEAFERFRGLMSDEGRRPVLVHCSSANRVGALLIPYLVLDEGRQQEEAERIALRVGLRSNRLRRAALRYTERETRTGETR